MTKERMPRLPWCRKELGHVLLHAPALTEPSTRRAADATLHRGIAEVEAESVALMIAATHGLDTSPYTIPYVSTWASSVPGMSPVEVVQATAERVRSTALDVLTRLDTDQIGNGSPPGLDRTAVTPKHHNPAAATQASTVRPDAVVLGE